jgi:hypothetical protein
MELSKTLVAVLGPPSEEKASRHYVGLPPMKPGDPETRQRMGWPRVILLASRQEGVFLERFDAARTEVGDTWHQSVDDAKAQAVTEYGGNLGPWTAVPTGESDPVGFALRLADPPQ